MGGTGPGDGVPSSQEDSSTAAGELESSEMEEPPAPLPPQGESLVPDDPDSFHLYLYKELSEIFVPLPREIGGELDGRGLAALVANGNPNLPAEVGLFADGGTVTIDIAVSDSDGYVDYNWLATVWATVTKNVSSVSQVRFTLDGAPYEAGQLDSDGTFLPLDPLPLPDHSMEELAEIRAQIPYEPVEREMNGQIYPIKDDETARLLAQFIERVTWWNLPGKSFDHIGSAEDGFIVMAAMLNAPMLYWGEYISYDEGTAYSGLDAFTQTCHDWQGQLKEHIEIVAAALFGEDASYEHGPYAINPWMYDEYGGIYTPPHIGIYGGWRPIVLDYVQEGGEYRVTAVFIQQYFEDYQDIFGNALSGDALAAYCQESLPRHEITIKQQADGSFIYSAHILPDRQLNPNISATEYLPIRQLEEETLLGVVRVEEEDLARVYVLDLDELVLDEDGDLYLAIPVFNGSALRVEELEWDGDTPQVTDVLYEYSLDGDFASYALSIQAALAEDRPIYRIVVAFEDREVAYLLAEELPPADYVLTAEGLS